MVKNKRDDKKWNAAVHPDEKWRLDPVRAEKEWNAAVQASEKTHPKPSPNEIALRAAVMQEQVKTHPELGLVSLDEIKRRHADAQKNNPAPASPSGKPGAH